jgi:hypothetical protein
MENPAPPEKSYFANRKKGKKSEPKCPFENCTYRNIAMKIAYIGTNYCGFEAQLKAELPFIEDKLFEALQKTRFIKN